MKQKRMSGIPEDELLPLPVIEAAIQNDHEALGKVLDHFQWYIRMRATRYRLDSQGALRKYVDEDLKAEMEYKIIESVTHRFKIRP